MRPDNTWFRRGKASLGVAVTTLAALATGGNAAYGFSTVWQPIEQAGYAVTAQIITSGTGGESYIDTHFGNPDFSPPIANLAVVDILPAGGALTGMRVRDPVGRHFNIVPRPEDPRLAPSGSDYESEMKNSPIEAAAAVVGFYPDGGGIRHDFVDSDGTFTTVDDPNAQSWESTEILGVNDQFMVVGYYVAPNTVITGLPEDIREPGMFLLFSLSVLGVGWLRPRRSGAGLPMRTAAN